MFAAVEEYSVLQNVNCYRCAFLIYPDAPWLWVFPDGPHRESIIWPSGDKVPKCQELRGLPLPKDPEWCNSTETPACILLAATRSDADLRVGVV